MPGPKPSEIRWSEVERQDLEKLVHRHGTGQQKALRGRIVLLAAAGKNNSEIARELKQSVDMVRRWRGRWVQVQPLGVKELRVAERLEDLPRSGTPPRLTADQICQIEQLACEKPAHSGRPISQWTGREIAEELVKRGIVDHISARHASRLLKKGVSSRT